MSRKRIIINDSKKYIAAYLAKKESPKNIPRSKKFISFGEFLIFSKYKIARLQNKIKTTSVEIKKDETLTDGIRMNVKAQIIAVILFLKSSV